MPGQSDSSTRERSETKISVEALDLMRLKELVQRRTVERIETMDLRDHRGQEQGQDTVLELPCAREVVEGGLQDASGESSELERVR